MPVLPFLRSRGRSHAPGPAALVVDWTACDGRGLCAELLPELVARDDWGYPVNEGGVVPPALREHAEQAVRSCPRLALSLEPRPA